MEAMETPTTAPLSNRVRALVVDDHPSTAATLARALAQLDKRLEVLSAHSAEDALLLARDKPVDILVTDMMMTGMNGLELIEKLQSHPGGKPAFILLVTAYDVPGLKITAHRLKVNEILIKPVRPERVTQLVGAALENLRGPAASSSSPAAPLLPRILIADDVSDNISLLARYLKNEGYTCIPASDGAEALTKIRAEMPDLILLDMNMPVKDGLQTLQEIRSDPAIGHLPVIILTAARIEPMDMQMALNIGADDYITKPFDRRELLARIRTRLRAKEAEDTIRRRNKELSLLPEIGRALSARASLDELGEIVLRRTVETLGAFAAHFVLLEEEKYTRKTYCFGNPNAQLPLPDLNPVFNRLREGRQGFVVTDAHQDLRWPASAEDPTRAVMIAPLWGRFDLLGFLALTHEAPGAFSAEQLLLLQAIASQAAIAVENNRLASLVKEQTPSSALSGIHTLSGLMQTARSTQVTQSAVIPWEEERAFDVLVNWVDNRYILTLREASPQKALHPATAPRNSTAPRF